MEQLEVLRQGVNDSHALMEASVRAPPLTWPVSQGPGALRPPRCSRHHMPAVRQDVGQVGAGRRWARRQRHAPLDGRRVSCPRPRHSERGRAQQRRWVAPSRRQRLLCGPRGRQRGPAARGVGPRGGRRGGTAKDGQPAQEAVRRDGDGAAGALFSCMLLPVWTLLLLLACHTLNLHNCAGLAGGVCHKARPHQAGPQGRGRAPGLVQRTLRLALPLGACPCEQRGRELHSCGRRRVKGERQRMVRAGGRAEQAGSGQRAGDVPGCVLRVAGSASAQRKIRWNPCMNVRPRCVDGPRSDHVVHQQAQAHVAPPVRRAPAGQRGRGTQAPQGDGHQAAAVRRRAKKRWHALSPLPSLSQTGQTCN